ncbi:MAG: TetR/AcrR family transcriptional regulator [Solirubrobacteraceae bacterium]|nr:TetR/AcrR family transcriptional regulator [Solirubrobacteraceae bacterium]
MPLRHITGSTHGGLPSSTDPRPSAAERGQLDSNGVVVEEPTTTRSARRVDDEAILLAARELVLTRGLERTTLTDIAREAGLSRMTVYRRWAGLPELLGAMMQREWEHVLALDPAELASRVEAAPDARAFLVDVVARATGELRGSELLRRIVIAEPHLLTPYLVERSGTMHRLARSLIAQGVAIGQSAGTIRAGDPELLATAVVLTAQSWMVSLGAGGAGQDPQVLDAELRFLLDRYLAPVGATPTDFESTP